MQPQPLTAPTPRELLAEPIRVGEPDVVGPLAVFPLFGPAAQLEYVAFSTGASNGLSVKELESGASVNDLFVINSTDKNVLLYEGEEVLGAQQNRTFDTSILIAAGSRLRVPVSCVEHGRWDGSRHGEDFAPAPQTAYPALRRLKNRQARAHLEFAKEARADQSAVWSEIADKSERMAAVSATGAMHDIFEGRRDRLAELRAAITVRDGQCGALAFIDGQPLVVDYVSRPDVFAVLHGPLVQGYALDALEATGERQPSAEIAAEFVDAVLDASATEHDGIGLGRDIRFGTPRVGGAGLVSGTELVQLTAFAEDADGTPPTGPVLRARVNRPSRRRAG